MIPKEDQINAVKEVTKDDPQLQKSMLKIIEIEYNTQMTRKKD